MKGIKKSLLAGLIAGAFCMKHCSAYASDEPQENAIESMGDWFCNLGTDIQNAGIVVADWTCDLVTDVQNSTAYLIDTTGKLISSIDLTSADCIIKDLLFMNYAISPQHCCIQPFEQDSKDVIFGHNWRS